MGKSVKDGVVLRTSPSALKKADPNDAYGCHRAWWFCYVQGIREPSGPAALLGTKTHKEIESYLKTGEPALGSIAMSAKHFIPSPGDDLLVEHHIGQGGFSIEDLPVKGFIDVVNPRLEYINPMGELLPGDCVEVIDWKTKSNVDFGLTGPQLVTDTQMAIYGKYVLEAWGMDSVRLSHVYMQTRGRSRSKKVTVKATAEQISKGWEYAEGLARLVKQLAAETDVSKLEINSRNCARCYYSSRCPKNDKQTIESIFGKAAAMSLLPELTPPVQNHLATIRKELTQAPSEFAQAVDFIHNSGLGFPELLGDAAQQYADLKGLEYSGGGLAGSGRAGGARVSDTADVVKLAKEIGDATGQPFTPVTAPIIPSAILMYAPESKPELAADPVEGWSAPAAPKTEAPKVQELAPPPEDVIKATTPPMVTNYAQQPPFKKMKKPELIEHCENMWVEIQNLKTQPQDLAVGLTVGEFGKVTAVLAEQAFVYVDCYVPEAKSLDPYIDDICKRLAEMGGAEDIRCAPKDSVLAYGAWKGVLAAMVRENPPNPGTYMLLVRDSEIKSVVADALGDLVVARGI